MVDPEIYRRRLERVEELLSELSEYSEKGAIIIVEGKRDVLSLKKLGIEGNFELATKQSLFNFSERIAQLGKQVIILTDWDQARRSAGCKTYRIFRELWLETRTRNQE